MRHWTELYIGLPYEEYDCASLCVKVCHEQFGKDVYLPTDRANNLKGISKQIDDLHDDFAVITSEPEEGDAVLMIGRGRINHVGIVCYINKQLYILHAMKNAGIAVLHSITNLNSVGLTIEGFYKWK